MGHAADAAGLQLGSRLFGLLIDLDYTDDVAVLADDEGKLCEALSRMEEEAGKLGLCVSWVKTNGQNFGYSAPESPVHINNEVVDAVTSFCYLGSTLTATYGLQLLPEKTEDVRRRIGIASSALNRLDRLWRDGHISHTTKFRIYSCWLVSVSVYGCETWMLTSVRRVAQT